LLGKDNVNSVRDHVIHHSGNGSFSIRRKEWKLVLANNSGGFTKGPPASTPGQLYKLDDDPGEQHNRWAEKPEIVEELSTLLKSIQEKGRSR